VSQREAEPVYVRLQISSVEINSVKESDLRMDATVMPLKQ